MGWRAFVRCRSSTFSASFNFSFVSISIYPPFNDNDDDADDDGHRTQSRSPHQTFNLNQSFNFVRISVPKPSTLLRQHDLSLKKRKKKSKNFFLFIFAFCVAWMEWFNSMGHTQFIVLRQYTSVSAAATDCRLPMVYLLGECVKIMGLVMVAVVVVSWFSRVMPSSTHNKTIINFAANRM